MKKKGNAKGASGKIRKATVRLGADTSNPTFFPRPDTAIKRCNGSRIAGDDLQAGKAAAAQPRV